MHRGKNFTNYNKAAAATQLAPQATPTSMRETELTAKTKNMTIKLFETIRRKVVYGEAAGYKNDTEPEYGSGKVELRANHEVVRD